MDFLVGVQGKDFTMVMTDKTIARSILVMKQDQDKMIQLNEKTLLCLAGEVGDCTNFGEYVQKNVQLYEKRNTIKLSTSACANFTRRELAGSLRSRNAYQVNLLVAGFDDKTEEPKLFWMDYFGSMVELPFAAHGYGANFCLGLLDRQFKKDLTREEAKQLLENCIQELSARFLINLSSFVVRSIDKDGIHDVDLNMTKKVSPAASG